MPSIDERVVSMAFENQVFESRVATTLATLGKLNETIKNVGTISGLGNIETEANKVTLQQPMSALDKLKAKLGFGKEAPQAFSEIENASQKVQLSGASRALDLLKSKLSFGREAPQAFSEIETASNKVTLQGVNRAIDTTAGHFSTLEKAANSVDISGNLGRGIDTVIGKFSALEVAGVAALGTISAKLTVAAGSFVKDLSLGPITQGLEEYTTNLNSIQTILANTQFQGSTLDDVNAALGQLNTYSDQTIYNFGQMAKNIGTFTAAGVDLDKSVSSIKGIANLAALSGSNSQQASTAMYQLSQAISAGKVGLQDWNSVVNAGMGGAVFQRALATTASNMGTVADGAIKIDEATGKATINGQSFRESIMAKPGQESWLTSDVLVATLEQFTGDMKEADLIAKGFTKSQAQAIIQQAATAKAAATEVKTLSQVFDVAKESIGSGWSKTFQLIFGDFEQAKKTFTELSQFINKFIGASADARNNVLKDWADLGGRAKLIEGIKDIFQALLSVLKPIKEAFRDIFPATTGKELFALTKGFADFAKSLTLSPQAAEDLRRTFRGLFAVLSIGKTIISEVVGVIFDLLGVAGGGAGTFLSFTGSIGDFLVAIDNAVSKGGALTGLFSGLTAVLRVPLELLGAVSSAIFGLFGGADTKGADDFAGSMENVKGSLKGLDGVLDSVAKAWDGFLKLLSDIRTAVSPWLNEIGQQISGFADLIKDAINNADWDSVFLALQTTFLGGLVLTIKKALGGGIKDIGGGVLGNVNDLLKGITGNLEAMQTKIKAEAILAIASAIAILAAGIYVISTIDGADLTRSMTAIAVGLGQLMGAMKLMSGIGGPAAFASLGIMAAGMVVLSTALVILAGAMKIFATMKWEELAKGMAGVGGGLAAIGVGMKLVSGPGILSAGLAMIPLAVGLAILAVAVKMFATLKWEDLAKGLLGVAGSLGAIALGLAALPTVQLVAAAGALVIMGVALSLLAGAVMAFGNIPFEKMLVGLFGVAGALAAIGISISLIPPTVALQAAGLVILAIALNGIASAIGILGAMSMGKIIKGLAAIAGALLIFAVGLTAMAGTLPGAAALLAAAVALGILAPALAFLGTLEWSTIIRGLAAIALSMGVIAVVGAVAAPGIVALGGALAVLGLGMLAISAAIYVVAKGISLLAEDGQKGVAVLLTALTAFVAILPTIVINFVKGLVEIVSSVAELAPKVILALGVIIDSILATVIRAAPKLAEAITVLLTQFVKVVNENGGPLLAAGLAMLVTFLSGLAGNIGKVTEQALLVVTRFLGELARNAPNMVASGVAVLTAFLKGVTDHIPKLVQTVFGLMTKFLEGVAVNLPKVVAMGAKVMVKFLGAIGSYIAKVVLAGVGILLKLVEGIGKAIPQVITKGVQVIGKLIRAMAEAAVKMVNVGFKAMINFMNGLADAIRKNSKAMTDAGFNIADAIVDGMVYGFSQLGGKAVDAVGDLVTSLPKKAWSLLDIHSPSGVFEDVGKNVVLGLVQGLESDAPAKTMDTAVRNMLDATREALSNASVLLDDAITLDPVITPVLDLSQVEREASKLVDLTNVVPITAAASFDQASAISQETAATAEAAVAIPSGDTNITLEQNNYSPESLDDVEIYRKTKNALGQVKTALGVPS